MAPSNLQTPGDLNGTSEVESLSENEVVGEYAHQLANLLTLPMVMQTAIELDLFQIIAAAQDSGHRITAPEIAERMPAADKEDAADKLGRILCLLAAFSVVTCCVDSCHGGRTYGLSPVGRYFVRDEDDVSLAPYLSLVQHEVNVKSWSKMKERILEGGVPFIGDPGRNLYDYSCLDLKFSNVFNLAMLNHTTMVMKRVLGAYKGFEKLKQLVDVGGGIGHTLKMIVSKYPAIKAINFDLSHVLEHAISHAGIDHVTGDMFETLPSPAEAILLKWILHNWKDEHCVKLLKNCYNALQKEGKVIVVEHVLPDEPETTMAAKTIFLMDVVMLTLLPKGRERTKAQFTALATAAGFSTIKFACHVCNFWVIEFCK